MSNDPYTKQIGRWIFRVREPDGAGPHPVTLLVHGWTGDENSMWVFAGRLPPDHILIAPRAPHAEPRGGFSWHIRTEESWPAIEDFRPAIEELLDLLTSESFPGVDFSKMRMVGFSQGAAMIYSLAFLYPARVIAMAGLSGFLPNGTEQMAVQAPLEGLPAFVAHGTQDKRVPIERGRQAVEILEQAGAKVTYCEDEVGHKLSLACFRGLEAFLKENG